MKRLSALMYILEMTETETPYKEFIDARSKPKL